MVVPQLVVQHVAEESSGFVRTAFGYTFARDQGFGRAWTPMVEVLTAMPNGATTEWDAVPQVQTVRRNEP